jgi:P27 family predicted phage terminase small subunit
MEAKVTGDTMRTKITPRLRPGIPTPPKRVQENPDALEEWNHTAPILVEARLLTHGDRAAFAAYCLTYARWCHAEDMLDELSGEWVQKSMRDNNILNPWIGIRQKLCDMMLRFQGEFGLTPSSRVSLGYRVPKGEAIEQSKRQAEAPGIPTIENFLDEVRSSVN